MAFHDSAIGGTDYVPAAGVRETMSPGQTTATVLIPLVGDSVRAFEAVERRVLAIAPQGTRKPVPRFRSGFLHIARGANIPILLAALDYGTRTVRLGPLLTPGDDVEAERERIEAMFRDVKGKKR